MKYVWLVLFIIIVGLGAGFLFWRNQQNAMITELTTSETTTTPKTPTMHWGVLIRAHALKKGSAPYSKTALDQQLDLAKELGVTDVRANIEVDDAINDDFVNLAIQKGLTPTLIIEPELGDFFNLATYQKAYDIAKKYATRYQGKVPYYQLANEASGSTVKPNASGNKLTDYDEKKYPAFKDWLRGLSDGVAAADPAAKRMVSAHWLGVAAIDKLATDKVNFEIIGWNWYSDMGNDLIKKLDDGTTLNIPQYFKAKYPAKEFWVVELNRRNGTLDKNYKAQADFLQTFITNVLSHKNTKGIFIFPLTDQCAEMDKDYGNMGLITIKDNGDGTCSIAAKKTAFTTYQKLIKANP